MATRTALSLPLMLGLALIGVTSAAPLPDGNSGIAARYPSDAGIASDPAVIFADDFESYSGAAGLTSKWNEAYHTANIRIATEAGNVFAGGKSLEFTVPQTSIEVSNTVAKVVSPERDALFLRYYARFDEGSTCWAPATTAAPSRLTTVVPACAPTATTSSLSATKRGGTTRPRPIQAGSTPMSTIRISATSGATISFPREWFCRFRARPSISGRRSFPARISRLCSAAGTATS